jgi:hypothetical protein
MNDVQIERADRRFARVKRYRPEKPAAEADTLQTVRAIFEKQRA